MKLNPPLQDGIFLDRPNRFAALVEVDGAATMVHVPNSGRMKDLLRKGTRVLLITRASPGRKTTYDMSLVDLGNTLVSTDARMPSTLVDETFAGGQPDQFSQYTWSRREVTFSHSRLDMVMGTSGVCYFEMKLVTLVEDGIGFFPGAPTSRGARHMDALAQAVEQGHRAVVVFVENAHAFSPNDEAGPVFGKALRETKVVGVEAYAYSCHVSPEEIVLEKQLPMNIPDNP
ncbi:MAG: DNA/RNA nuclease SfsA [Dehalococcoidia bacterium]|nr:DNA/RNA nuclease SfsA [Dehalococcoidia bacterium]